LPTRTISRSLTFIMAAAIGVIVANLYYLQPLLHHVKRDFHTSTLAATALITLMQVGYAAGLAFVVPLGDLIPRRRLVVVIFSLAAAAMLLGSLIHSFVLFAILTIFIGLTSVGGQTIIPFAADLADEDQRGRVIARLMTGLLSGVLLSRTLSGAVSEAVGWRGVYVSAAALLLVMAVVLRLVLPTEARREHVPYHRLVSSSFALLGKFPELRRRAWFGATVFAANSIMWTTLAFHLSGAPFHFSNGVIGLFGLLGVAGVLAANAAGHQADRNRNERSTFVAAALVAGSFLVLLLGHATVWILGLGIVLLDAGVQGMNITNQSIIYTLAPDMRSRINSIYMVCFFTGASLGSLGAGFTYSHDGWTGTCILGLGIGAAAMVPALRWRTPPTSAH
jgi:predicted MFS family arabinose efflux permease